MVMSRCTHQPGLTAEEAAVFQVLSEALHGRLNLADVAMAKLLIDGEQVDVDRITTLVWGHWLQTRRADAVDGG